LKALKELGRTSVPCIMRAYENEFEERKDLLAYNKQREKKLSQRMAEADEYEEIFAEEARLRQVEAGKKYGENHPKSKLNKSLVPKETNL